MKEPETRHLKELGFIKLDTDVLLQWFFSLITYNLHICFISFSWFVLSPRTKLGWK